MDHELPGDRETRGRERFGARQNRVIKNALSAPWKCDLCGAVLPTDRDVTEHKFDTGHSLYSGSESTKENAGGVDQASLGSQYPAQTTSALPGKEKGSDALARTAICKICHASLSIKDFTDPDAESQMQVHLRDEHGGLLPGPSASTFFALGNDDSGNVPVPGDAEDMGRRAFGKATA
jgi:hypothetical protein